MTFAQAKVIDIVWDIVVGRGGQGILAIVSYRVFSKCLTRLIEREHLSATYRLYEAIVFRDASLQSIWQLCTSFTKNMKQRDSAAICWIILASAYVVVFPTWVSAMTGYSSNVSPFIETDSGSKVPWKNRRALYKIHDGNRIGKTVDYLVGSEGFGPHSDYYGGDSEYFGCLSDLAYVEGLNPTDYSDYDVSKLCQLANNTSNCKATPTHIQLPSRTTSTDVPLDVAKYGSNTAHNLSSVFNGIQSSAPTLNITAYSTNFATKLYQDWRDEEGYLNFSTAGAPDQANLPIMYSVNGTAYEQQDILDHRASCVSLPNYQWGFSFLLLFLFLIVSIVWTIGMCVMYQDAYWNSRLDRGPRNLGLFRGVADVNKALEMDGVAPSELASEKEIRRLLDKREGEITFANLDTTGMTTRAAELRAWAKDTPSLCGWLEPWGILQWTWLLILVLIGLPFCNYFIYHMVMPLPWWLCCILLFCGLCSTVIRMVRRHRGQHPHDTFNP